jgi:hypothetical protein
MQPRRQLYAFAHLVLRDEAHARPIETWTALTSPTWSDFLAWFWQRAAEGGPSLPVQGLGVEGVFPRAGFEILVLRMPPPEAMTEAYYVAFARRPEQPASLGYFVLERGAESVYVAEWRPGGTRIRQDDLPAPTVDALLARLEHELGARGPNPFAAVQLPPPSTPPPAGGVPRSLPPPGMPSSMPPPPMGRPAMGSLPPMPTPPPGLGSQPPPQMPPPQMPPPGGGFAQPGYPPGAAPYAPGFPPNAPQKPSSKVGLFIGLGVVGLIALLMVWRVIAAVQQSREMKARVAAEEADQAVADRIDAAAVAAKAPQDAARTALSGCEKREAMQVGALILRALPDGKTLPATKKPKDRARTAQAVLYAQAKSGATAADDATRDLVKGWIAPNARMCSRRSTELSDALTKLLGARPTGDVANAAAADAWIATINAKAAELAAANKALETAPIPAVVAVRTEDCSTRALSSYSSTSGLGTRATLDAYTCRVQIAWISGAEVLAAVVATGSGTPKDPGDLVNEDTLAAYNRGARIAAISNADASVRKQVAGW